MCVCICGLLHKWDDNKFLLCWSSTTEKKITGTGTRLGMWLNYQPTKPSTHTNAHTQTEYRRALETKQLVVFLGWMDTWWMEEDLISSKLGPTSLVRCMSTGPLVVIQIMTAVSQRQWCKKHDKTSNIFVTLNCIPSSLTWLIEGADTQHWPWQTIGAENKLVWACVVCHRGRQQQMHHPDWTTFTTCCVTHHSSFTYNCTVALSQPECWCKRIRHNSLTWLIFWHTAVSLVIAGLIKYVLSPDYVKLIILLFTLWSSNDLNKWPAAQTRMALSRVHTVFKLARSGFISGTASFGITLIL